MNYKHIALLVMLVAATASLFFFSSWVNAMVVSGEGVFSGAETMGKISPLFAGFLAVIAIGVLVRIIFG